MCEKNNKMPEFYMILNRKIKKKSEFYMTFARKMPEFYIIIALKYFSRFFFFGGGGTCNAPVSYAYMNEVCKSCVSLAGETTWQ